MCLMLVASTIAPTQVVSAQTAAAREYQVYPLKHKSAQEVERLLSKALPDLGEPVHAVADSRSNQILLQGSARAQQFARQLIESVDQPSAPTAAPAFAEEASLLKAYTVADPQAVLTQLRRLYPDESSVRLAAEPESRQLVVLATPSVQRSIEGQLSRAPRSAARNDASPTGGLAANSSGRAPSASSAVTPHPVAAATALSPTQTPADPPPVGQFTVRLVHSQAGQVEASLLRALGTRLEPAQAASPTSGSGYRLKNAAGEWAELLVDERNNLIQVRGRTELARQLARLVQALDGPAGTRDRMTRIVPFRLADPVKVKQAIDAYRGEPVPPAKPPADASSSIQDAQRPGRAAIRRTPPTSGVALVGYIFEGEAAPAPAGVVPADQLPPMDAAPAAEGDEPTRQQQLRALGMDVDIETLPDLDVVILRGRDRDVEELARIIEELERLSAEAQPEIQVYPLRHVRGSALSRIITQTSRDLVGSRQGRASVISLEKPNALLLIGWGEALNVVKELIRKLDQPVAPDTQLEVFPLRNALGQPTARLLEQFYAGRQGLGPQLIVAFDPRSESLIVQASPRDLEEVRHLLEHLDAPQAKVNLARIFKLRNVLAIDIAQTLEAAIRAVRDGSDDERTAILEFLAVDGEEERLVRSGLLVPVEITPNARNNTLLVTAPPESMELLAALIEQLDSEVAVAQIKVFRVVNGDANSLILMLRSLFPAEIGAGGPTLAGAEGEGSLVGLRFSVDTRSNSIIATGSEGDLKIIEALLLRLDERGLNERQNEVYRLKNAPALDVANAINEFLRSERIVQQAMPGVESPFEQIEREVVVVPEQISNSLILSATPRFFAEIEQLIEKLDAQPAQVMIQVLIAEVSLDNLDEFGIEIGLQDSVLFDRSLLGDLLTTTSTTALSTDQGVVTSTQQVIQAATNTPGFGFNTTPVPSLPNSGSERSRATSSTVAPQGLTNFSLGRMNNEAGFGGLVLSASSESVSVLIRALQESRRVDILSRPQVRTLDNQPAFIQIGERVPRVARSTVTTGGNITNEIELENVGLILGVTPRISPDGMVVMEIDAEKSELGREAEGIPISISQQGTIIRAPIVRTTVAQATVSSADGETIVLGGLITKSTSMIERKVPYLADIPLLGQLFRYDSKQGLRRELLIILTPYVIRGAEDSERIRYLETARMSWCCSDVHAIHGVAGLCDITNCAICAQQVPAFYPDFDPQGVRPLSAPPGTELLHPDGEFIPTAPRSPALFPSQPADPLPFRDSSPSDQRYPARPEAGPGFVAPPDPRQENRGPPPAAPPAPSQ